MLTVYFPGVWDLLHVGHIKALERAAKFSDELVIGVPSDEVVLEDKGRLPIIPLDQRMSMLRALRCVDVVEPYFELSFIVHLNTFFPDILAVGSTWGRRCRHLDAEKWMHAHDGRIVTLPYTSSVSSTEIKQRIIDQAGEST